MSRQVSVGGKERPILFSGEMVRAILEGRKTQTRRVCKPEHFNGSEMPSDHAMENAIRFGAKCPYGQVGDRLWVKETFGLHDNRQPTIVYYRADNELKYESDGPWTPSIFMRREYSRITLEIVSVRVERLNEISEADAAAEGVERNASVIDGSWSPEDGYIKYPIDENLEDFPAWTAVESYQTLWESINGAGSWAANPWVWVIEFKRVKP